MSLEKITIEYADQNEAFGAFFPRESRVVKEFTSSSGKKCLLVELDEPFTYGLPNRFGNHMLENTHLLLTTRIVGEELSDKVFEVHVVLVPELPDLSKDTIEIDKSMHVAWCIAKRP